MSGQVRRVNRQKTRPDLITQIFVCIPTSAKSELATPISVSIPKNEERALSITSSITYYRMRTKYITNKTKSQSDSEDDIEMSDLEKTTQNLPD